MSVDIYYKYNFRYDKKLYMENLKKTLNEKGIKNLSDFRALLLKCGCESYETARSYYNLRRVLPLNILGSICKNLKLNSDEIMFPNSIFKYDFTKGIGANTDELNYTSSLLQNVFIYNNTSSDYIYTLSLVLAKYNYLLQKHYYASLSNTELTELGNFSTNFLKEKKSNKVLDWHEFLNWEKELVTDDFISEFYDKYTLVCLNSKDGEIVECKFLLQNKKDIVDNKIFNDLNNLLPPQDKIV